MAKIGKKSCNQKGSVPLINSERKFDAANTSTNDCRCHTELVLSTTYDCNQITDYINK